MKVREQHRTVKPFATGAWAITASAALTLAGCGGDSNPIVSTDANLASIVVAKPAERCAALQGLQIPASEIGLPTSGVSITSTSLKSADATTGLPEYCQVTGAVVASKTSDPPINFQLNLPTRWNKKALQMGGGGFNGVVVTGLGNVVNSPSTATTPLARGYVTFGGDSGHKGVGFDGSFGTNAQALANYSGESVKRTHDAALAVSNRYYPVSPSKTYYAGGSKGGHEGLIAVQRYANDYDGVIAYYPANQQVALVMSWYTMWQAAYRQPGAALNATQQQLLKNKVLSACDALDGVADGIVSNLQACAASFSINSLRCPDGASSTDTCLSDAQINTLKLAASPMQFAFPLANGITSIGPYPVFNGGDITGTLFDTGGTGTTTAYFGFVDQTIRYIYQQDGAASSENFDYTKWQPRLSQISQMYDATNPDIDAFRAKGGKLILVQGTTDMLVPQPATSAYYGKLSARYGSSLPTFVRYFLAPGFGHGSGSFQLNWDSLSALEAWTDSGQAPVEPVAVDANAATKGRTRPLCDYPLWPKYKGAGDPNLAASFTCVSS